MTWTSTSNCAAASQARQVPRRIETDLGGDRGWTGPATALDGTSGKACCSFTARRCTPRTVPGRWADPQPGHGETRPPRVSTQADLTRIPRHRARA